MGAFSLRFKVIQFGLSFTNRADSCKGGYRKRTVSMVMVTLHVKKNIETNAIGRFRKQDIANGDISVLHV
jgi:hypothetical protein